MPLYRYLLVMYQTLLQYIIDYSSMKVSDQEFEMIQSAFKPKKLRKRQYLLQEGDVCKYLSFICKGAMRQYSVDNKGVEHIVRFGIERWWMADYESFTTKIPCSYDIDAIEDTELLQISSEHLDELKAKVPAIDAMIEKMNQRSYVSHQKTHPLIHQSNC